MIGKTLTNIIYVDIIEIVNGFEPYFYMGRRAILVQKTLNNNLEQIISAFPQYGKKCKDFSVKQLAQKLSLNELDVYTTITSHPDLFLWITTKRVTLIPLALKAIRDAFELHNYIPLNVDIECVKIIRNAFAVKSVNSNGVKNILSATNKKELSYADFVDCETRYYDIFNSVAPEHCKVPADYYLNLYPDYSDEDYIKELNDIFEANTRTSEMLYKKQDGQTLSEIGEREGISRERVRKLIEKPIISVTDWVFKYERILAKRYLTGDGTLSEKMIKEDISDENWKIVKNIIIEQNDKLRFIRYDPTLDVIFKDIYKIDKIIERFSANSYKTFSEYAKDVLSSTSVRGYGFLNDLNLEMFLSTRTHLLPNGIHASKKRTLSSVLSTIIFDKFPDGIKISDFDKIQEIIDIAKDKYGIDTDGKDPLRNVAVKIQTSCYLIDKGTYSASEPPQLPSALLERIHAIVSDNSVKFISYESLYKRLNNELKEYGICNSYAMHGALKNQLDYPDITMTKDYMFTKEEQGSSSAERFEVIKDFLDSAEEPVLVSDILDEFKSIDEKELRILSLYFPQVIKWDENSYCSIDSLPIDACIVDILRGTINKLINNEYHYTGEYALYAEMQKSHSDVLDLLGIESSQQLFSVVSWLLRNEYHFSSPHIVKSFEGDRFSTDHLIKMYTDSINDCILNKKDMISKISSMCGRTSSTILLAINKALSAYIRVSQNEYISPSNLGITDEVLSEIGSFIKSRLDDGALLIDENLDVSGLPKVNIDWTPQMLISVIRIYDLGYGILSLCSPPAPLSVVAYDKKIDIITIERRFGRKS